MFYPNQHNELSFEKAQPLLIKYFNISTDPRLLKSMKQEYGGNSITYTKETWSEFIIKTYEKYMNDKVQRMQGVMRRLSMNLPTDDIWKYLYALKKFESIITRNTNKNV